MSPTLARIESAFEAWQGTEITQHRREVAERGEELVEERGRGPERPSPAMR